MPSDIIAGLVLLRQRQRAKRNAVLDEVSTYPPTPYPPALLLLILWYPLPMGPQATVYCSLPSSVLAETFSQPFH